VLAALESKDRHVLEQLVVTQAEFRKYVWPSIADEAGNGKMDAEGYYLIYALSSRAGLSDRLAELGGRKWQLVGLVFATNTKPTKGYRLLLRPQVKIRDASGQEKTIPLISGVLEHNGTCKVMSFYVGSGQTAQN